MFKKSFNRIVREHPVHHSRNTVARYTLNCVEIFQLNSAIYPAIPPCNFNILFFLTKRRKRSTRGSFVMYNRRIKFYYSLQFASRDRRTYLFMTLANARLKCYRGSPSNIERHNVLCTKCLIALQSHENCFLSFSY